jgi:hypothetical protein
MNTEHMQPTCIYGGGVKTNTNPLKLLCRRRLNLKFLICSMLLLSAVTVTSAQQLSFTVSADTVYSADHIVITNTSSGVPSWASFEWVFSGATNITFLDTASYLDSMTFVMNDSLFTIIPGYPNNNPWDSLKIVLIAKDTNGIPLNYPAARHGMVLGLYLWTSVCTNIPDPCVNLVCNGSFETISSTAIEPKALYYAESWYGLDAEVFNTNANHFLYPWEFDVPVNMFGTQAASSGIGYAGFHPRWAPNTPTYHQEVITTVLTENLYSGQNYTVKFKASLAEASSKANSLIVYIDDNAPTMSYGVDLYSAIASNPTGVVTNGQGFITDKNNWVLVQGTYAPAANTFQPPKMIIGAPDQSSEVTVSGGNPSIPGLAYYYIDDVAVVPDPPYIELFSEVAGPCNQYYVEAKNPQNVASYQWIVNGVPEPGATSTSAYLFSKGPLIECEVTNFHGCKRVFQVNVEYCVHDHSNGSAYNIIVNNMNVADIRNMYTGGSSTWTTNEPINILGTLTIDEDFTFLDCPQIVMGRDAKIVVKPNLTPGIVLTINQCTIYSCNFECFMWDGIYATDPNSSVLIYESTISHAKNAVYSRNNPELDIRGNTFSNNLIGIHLTNHQRDCSPGLPGQNPPPIPANAMISSNTFTGDLWNFQAFLSQYLPGFNGMEWGIRVDTVDLLTIGSSNTFRDLSCGIHINTGNVVIENNTFENISHHTNMPGVDEPFGHIVNSQYKEGAIVVNKKLPAGSGGSTLPPSIYCVPASLAVEQNYFENCRMGVYAWKVPVIMTENTFLNTKYNALRGHELISAEIKRNTHTYNNVQILAPLNVFNYEYYIGQTVPQYLVGYSIDISENVVTTYKSGMMLINATSTGIPDQQPQRRVDIHHNLIQLNDVSSDPWLHGIRLHGCDRAIVRSNEIKNIDLADYPLTNKPMNNFHGIHVAQSVNANIYSNDPIKRFGKGVYNIGFNEGTQYWCNHFVENYDGFYVEAPGAGISTWVSDQLLSHDENKNCFHGNVNYRVNNQSGGNPMWFFSGSDDPSNCFAPCENYNLSFMANEHLGAEVTCRNTTFEYEDSGIRENLFGAVVRDEDTLYGGLQTEFEWYARGHLYRTLLGDTSFIYMGVSEDSVYANFFSFFSNSNIAAFEVISDLIAHHELEQALWDNQSIVTQTLVEFNLQRVYEAYLNSWAQDRELDSAQAALLYNIALLTPYVGGNAVYTARVMLDIDPLNYGLAYKEGKETFYPGKLDMHLYPNPASGYLLVELKGLGDMEGAWLEMYDLQGRLVYRHRDIINGGQLHLSITDIKDGLYLVRVMLDNGTQSTRKLIVRK